MLAVLLSEAAGDPYLSIVSIPLVVYFVLARLTSRRPHLNIRVGRRGGDEQLYEDDSRVFSVTVRNEGGSLDMVEVVDILPHGLKIAAGSNRLYASLKNGEEAMMRYSVSSPAFGSFVVGPVRVRVMDAFGFFAEEMTVESRERLVVFPKLQMLEHLELGLQKVKHWPGEMISSRTGQGMEFYSIRPHAPEDLPRSINWRATARSEGLQTNQFVSELGGEAMLVLDARASSLLGPPPDTLLRHSIRATASIAYSLLRDRDRVGLLAVGESLVKVAPGFGRRQFDRLLYALMGVEGGSMWEMKHLPQYLRLLYPKVNQLVVVTPLADSGVYSALAELASMGYAMTVVSPSPFELERKTMRIGRVEEAAERLARMDRANRMEALGRYAAMVDWRVERPLGQSLSEGILAWRKRQGR